MSAISGTGSSTTNPYSSVNNKSVEEDEESKATEESSDSEEISSTESTTDAEELAAYKKSFAAKLQSSMNKPYLADVSLNLNISDAGFKRMMTDEAYESKVMNQIESKTSHSYVAFSGTLNISVDGKDDGVSTSLDRKESMARQLFGNTRSLLRRTNIDSLSTMAVETMEYRLKNGSKFETVGQLGAQSMRTTSSYLSAYLQSVGSIDTTG